MSKTQTGTFFNEKWMQDNELDVLLAQEQTRQARAARGPELRMELQQLEPETTPSDKSSVDDQ